MERAKQQTMQSNEMYNHFLKIQNFKLYQHVTENENVLGRYFLSTGRFIDMLKALRTLEM